LYLLLEYTFLAYAAETSLQHFFVGSLQFLRFVEGKTVILKWMISIIRKVLTYFRENDSNLFKQQRLKYIKPEEDPRSVREKENW